MTRRRRRKRSKRLGYVTANLKGCRAASRKRKKPCRYGVNKNTGACLKHPRKRRK